MDSSTEPTEIIEDDEVQIGRFTGWCTKTSYSLEYWEIFITTRRVIFCRIGESYSSLLLKADMGGSHRDRLGEMSLDAIIEFDSQNVTVPVEELKRISYTEKSIGRKSTLTIEWDDDEMRLYNVSGTSSADETVATMNDLANHDTYADVSIETSVTEGPLQKLRQAVGL